MSRLAGRALRVQPWAAAKHGPPGAQRIGSWMSGAS